MKELELNQIDKVCGAADNNSFIIQKPEDIEWQIETNARQAGILGSVVGVPVGFFVGFGLTTSLFAGTVSAIAGAYVGHSLGYNLESTCSEYLYKH